MLRAILIPLLAAQSLAMAEAAPQSLDTPPVAVEVQVTVLGADGAPVVGLPLRVVPGHTPAWQTPDAGAALVTNGAGVVRLAAQLVLEERRHKMPSNFFTSLVAPAERTRHIQIGVEMAYAGRPWLTAIDIDRFENGTSAQLQARRVFARAGNGHFTDAVPPRDGVHRATLSKGLVLSVPGFDVSAATLDPDTTQPGQVRWRLALVLRRWPEPVLRD